MGEPSDRARRPISKLLPFTASDVRCAVVTTSTTSSAARRVLSLLVVSVCCVPGVSTFAQSNADRERDPLRSSQSAARIYVASRECDDNVTADNLRISAAYTELVAEMLSRSPTFRRQYARLARAPFLSVVLRSDMPPGRRVPALTQLLFRGGGTEALVHVTPSARSSELIAHELEHIIEQTSTLADAAA